MPSKPPLAPSDVKPLNAADMAKDLNAKYGMNEGEVSTTLEEYHSGLSRNGSKDSTAIDSENSRMDSKASSNTTYNSAMSGQSQLTDRDTGFSTDDS